MFLNSESEILLSFRALEILRLIESYLERAKACILVCLVTFFSSFLLTKVRAVEAAPQMAAATPTGTATTTPIPDKAAIRVPEERKVVNPPRVKTDKWIIFRVFLYFFQNSPVVVNFLHDLLAVLAYLSHAEVFFLVLHQKRVHQDIYFFQALVERKAAS